MLKIVLLLVYMMGGELVVEQKSFNKPEECQVAAGKRMNDVQSHPKFEGGYFAACIPARVREA